MDINSLLSPQESPATETPPPPSALSSPSLLSPHKRPPLRHMPSRTPSGLSQQVTSSPHYPRDTLQTPSHYHQQHVATPPTTHSPGFTTFPNGRQVHSTSNTPPIDLRGQLGSPHDARLTPPHPLSRQASTPGMDALAGTSLWHTMGRGDETLTNSAPDLASMQQQQQAARQSAGGLRDPQVYQSPRPSIRYDIAMAEGSPRPRVFSSRALDADSTETLNQLEKALKDNPFDYYSHSSFVNILHQGLQNTINSDEDPRTYDLLPVLREAYETMNSKYPLGEQLWEYRISDEKALARTMEERMDVLELCKTATQDEPFSARLWVMYSDYISYLISCAWDPNPPEQWPQDEKAIGREIFTPDLLLDTLRRGAEFVKYNVNDSSLVWDRYLQALQDDLERRYHADKVRQLSATFEERLSQPHASWDNTFSTFSQFNTRYNSNNYDAIMQHTSKRTVNVKKQYAGREEYEFSLLKAIQAQDREAEFHSLTRYLKWEKKTMGPFSFNLANALYERATLRFPVDATIWEDYIEFLIWQNNRAVSLEEVLERATRHCPWSGSLWSHRILTLEAENKSFNEIERVKHNATETGLLEHTDLEELIRVQIAWCGYLRRKAFDSPNATEDDADIAEVGIRSALELVNEMGIKKYGNDWVGDPKYRLERIHIKFWIQFGKVDEARSIWDSLFNLHQDSYDFWYRYYIFEMVVWSNHAVRDKNNMGQELLTPTQATAVLERGMKRLHTIDQPELLIEMYINHCEQHESALKVRSAQIEYRRTEKVVAIRRQKEYEEAQAKHYEAATSEQQAYSSNYVPDASSSGKRKLDDVQGMEDPVPKKSRQVDETTQAIVPSTKAPTQDASETPLDANENQPKRDREHTSIIVQNLPKETTQTRVRQYFTNVGEVRNVTLKPERNSITATVEFASSEEAEYALTKEAKGFDGAEIRITRGESSTLYVANYPPNADEGFIRSLFNPYGEILEIRFPSLKFDTHRRFCYVQFSSRNEAVSATKLDGTEVKGYKLIAQISDPTAKKKREGATAEGREIYIWHMNFKVKKHEVKEAFAKFGKIENVRIPTLPNGNNKGYCYVIYEDKESADAAVAEMDRINFFGFDDLHVQIAGDKNLTRPKFRSTVENTTSPEPREATPGQAQKTPDATPAPVAERSIALLGLPDTVNDARIQELVEPYGFKRITLIPKHQGAIIEFQTVEALGKASLVLDGREISEGRKIRVGTVAELVKMKGEYKPKNSFIQPTRVNRPVAKGSGLRGKGKPGLTLRGAMPKGGSSAREEAKSNEDFRKMLLTGKEKGKVPNRDEDKEMKDG
ncbi:hypothetical protein CC78DRAFT_522691 [Lojkania enalia]|uniref:U4/U6 snRNA-associated-splicing factor PRP24 n=1 Tax=Lojkania enalia TaxID=147567 RepID=A0A9P4K3T5_9PLEO|nr:hypothetical protein CC78DRAFT_522691 [Didymosphaeria enalia]